MGSTDNDTALGLTPYNEREVSRAEDYHQSNYIHILTPDGDPAEDK